MPSINDIVQVAEALEKCPVTVMEDRCSHVRNRNSSCRECVSACPENAIEVFANEINLSASKCVGCGVCAAVCPNEALVFNKPTDVELAQGAARGALENAGCAVIACARIASKRRVDPSRFAQVPCLGRVEESILINLIAHGAQEIMLVDGDCQTCKHQGSVPYIDAAVELSNHMLDVLGSSARVVRRSGFPDEMQSQDLQGAFGSSRRAFFSEAAGAAKETVITAAKTTIAQDLGYSENQDPIGQRLRVTQDGTLPLLDMPRRDILINALDALGQPVLDQLQTRRFATLEIDADKCNACGMCAVFCPTGALKRPEGEKLSDPVSSLLFLACECVQCGLCADVCWKRALQLSDIVAISELFSFDPRIFDLRNAKQDNNALFGADR